MATIARQSRLLQTAIAALLLITLPQSIYGVTLEYQVKASLTFNILHFVNWPAKNNAESIPLNLCVLGENRFAEAIHVLSGEQVAGRAIAVQHFPEPTTANIHGCDIAYFIDSSQVNEGALLAAARDRTVLTFGESDSFLASGGLVRFFLAGDKIKFAVNVAAAEPAGIYFSSKLLRLAEAVIKP